MKSAERRLGLFQNGRRLGLLTRTPSGLALDYDPDWLSRDGATPVSLSLPLDPSGHRGEPVLTFLDNLLPDSEGVRARLAVRVDAPDTHPHSLLSRLGRCSAGAVTFVPEGAQPGPAGDARGEPISDEEIAKRIAALGRQPLGVSATFRISLAGAQQKTALLWKKGSWQSPLGFTPTTHILKPQIGQVMGADFSRSVENEFFCLTLAAAFGLDAAAARIEDFEEARALVVERFDRCWTEDGRLLRVPHEDFAQALGVPSRQKYEDDGGPGMTRLLGLLEGSVAPAADRRTFLRAQVFFWLIAATDGHAKNYSLRLLPGGRFRLAPLYDIVSVQPALASGELPADEATMSLAVGNEDIRAVGRIEPRHFVASGVAAGVSARITREVLAEFLETRVAAFDRTRECLPEGFPEDMASAILDGAGSRLRETERYLAGETDPLS